MYSQNYGLRITRLDIYLKGPFSVEPSTGNMGNAPKHASYLNDGIVTIFIDDCEGNSVPKIPF